jgi:hypothetical protein
MWSLHSSYTHDGIAMIPSLSIVRIVFVFLYLVLDLILTSCVTFSGEAKVKARHGILTLSDII